MPSSPTTSGMSPVIIRGRCQKIRSGARTANAPQQAVATQQDRGRERGPAGLLAEPDQHEHRQEGHRDLGPGAELPGGRQRRAERGGSPARWRRAGRSERRRRRRTATARRPIGAGSVPRRRERRVPGRTSRRGRPWPGRAACSRGWSRCRARRGRRPATRRGRRARRTRTSGISGRAGRARTSWSPWVATPPGGAPGTTVPRRRRVRASPAGLDLRAVPGTRSVVARSHPPDRRSTRGARPLG